MEVGINTGMEQADLLKNRRCNPAGFMHRGENSAEVLRRQQDGRAFSPDTVVIDSRNPETVLAHKVRTPGSSSTGVR